MRREVINNKLLPLPSRQAIHSGGLPSTFRTRLWPVFCRTSVRRAAFASDYFTSLLDRVLLGCCCLLLFLRLFCFFFFFFKVFYFNYLVFIMFSYGLLFYSDFFSFFFTPPTPPSQPADVNECVLGPRAASASQVQIEKDVPRALPG